MTTHSRSAPRVLIGDAPRRSDLVERLKAAMSPQTMLESLRGEWDHPRASASEVVACQLMRVHPRGSDEFLMEYEVCLRDEQGAYQRRVFGELAAGDAEARLAEARGSLRKLRRNGPSSEAPAGQLSCLPSLGMVLRFSGLDERLPGFFLLHKPRALLPALHGHMLPEAERIECLDTEILGHRLGKRCTVRFRFETRDPQSGRLRAHSAIGKMYSRHGDRGAQVASWMALLRNAGFDDASAVRIPAPFAYLDDRETLLMEDADGTPLAEHTGADYARGAAAAGRALAKLHHCDVRVPQSHTVDDELALLEGWAQLVSEVHAGLATATAGALERVQAALEMHRDAPTTLVHRDYYDKQVLVEGTRIVVIDLDTLCLSDPAIDAGNFLAHMRLCRAQGLDVPEDADEEFLAAYDAPAGDDFEARLAAYVDSTLLRLACLYSFRPQWRHVPGKLLRQIC